jgi:hypothetical protein
VNLEADVWRCGPSAMLASSEDDAAVGDKSSAEEATSRGDEAHADGSKEDEPGKFAWDSRLTPQSGSCSSQLEFRGCKEDSDRKREARQAWNAERSPIQRRAPKEWWTYAMWKNMPAGSSTDDAMQSSRATEGRVREGSPSRSSSVRHQRKRRRNEKDRSGDKND